MRDVPATSRLSLSSALTVPSLIEWLRKSMIDSTSLCCFSDMVVGGMELSRNRFGFQAAHTLTFTLRLPANNSPPRSKCQHEQAPGQTRNTATNKDTRKS